MSHIDKGDDSMTVEYEWDCETVDTDSGDILEHCHMNRFSELVAHTKQFPPATGTRYDLCLVRDDDDGRSWAYLTGEQLPDYLSDAYDQKVAKVPVRFIREVSAHIHKLRGAQL
jgi:hypothetical protein